MARPPSRVDCLVKSIALPIVMEVFLALIDAIINTKVKSTSDIDRCVVVALKPVNRRTIDAGKRDEKEILMRNEA